MAGISLPTIVVSIIILFSGNLLLAVCGTTSIEDFGKAISGLEAIEFDYPQSNATEDLVYFQRILRQQGEQILNEMKKCDSGYAESCYTAIVIRNAAVKNLEKQNNALQRVLFELKNSIDSDFARLVFLGIENETREFQEIYIAKKRFENTEKTSNCTDDLESKIMCINYYLDLFETRWKIEPYISASNIVIGKNSAYEKQKSLSAKVQEKINELENELEAQAAQFETLSKNLEIAAAEVKDEDLSVLESESYEIKHSAGITAKENIKIYLKYTNDRENEIQNKIKRKERFYLKNALDFYSEKNIQLEENLNFYTSVLENLNAELEALSEKYEKIETKFKSRMQIVSSKTISGKIKILRHNLEIYETLKLQDSELKSEKEKILKEIYLLEPLGIKLSSEKSDVSKAKSVEELADIQNSIFRKKQSYESEFQELMKEFENKKYFLSKVNYEISTDARTIEELRKEINNADKIIEQKKTEFVAVGKVNMPLEKPICNSEIRYIEIYEVKNNLDIKIESYKIDTFVLTLLPYESKILQKNSTARIKCTIDRQVIRADQYWKYINSKVKIESIFSEALLEIKDYKLLSGYAKPFDSLLLLEEKENELLYKQKINLGIKKSEYSIDSDTIFEVELTNYDENFEKFTYEVEKSGNASCDNCRQLYDKIIFEFSNFDVGETIFAKFRINGNVIEKDTEDIALPAFEKDYENETQQYLQQENNLCWLVELSDNCTQIIEQEIGEKTRIKEINLLIDKAKKAGIDVSKFEIRIKEIEIISTNEDIIRYFTEAESINETLSSEIENLKATAQDKIVQAKQKFENSEEKNVLYSYLEAAVGDFQQEKYSSAIENSDKILNYSEAKQDFTPYYVVAALAVIGAGVWFFSNKKKEFKPLEKKVLKVFEEEF